MGWIIFLFIIIGIFTLLVLLANNQSMNLNKKREEIKAVFKKHDRRIGQYLIDENCSNGLGIDDDGNFLLVNNYGNSISSSFIKSNNIIQVELIEDGQSIIKASRGSQITGALVGGILAGGIGTIVGGLSGTKKQSTKVKKLVLRITLNDLNNPIKNIIILDRPTAIDKDKPTYKVMYIRALEWQKKIEISANRYASLSVN